MSEMYLIIDGYNLMHACGMAKEIYAPGELERRRHWFLNHLTARLTERELARATLVFDAFDAPPGIPRRFHYRGLHILFAPPGSDADSQIEELVAKHSAPRQILVISGDHRLQRAARRRRGQFASSDQFAELLIRRKPRNLDEQTPESNARVRDPKFGDPLTSDETVEWLAYFESLHLPDVIESSAALKGEAASPAPSQAADDSASQPGVSSATSSASTQSEAARPETASSVSPAPPEKAAPRLTDAFDDDDLESWLKVFGDLSEIESLEAEAGDEPEPQTSPNTHPASASPPSPAADKTAPSAQQSPSKSASKRPPQREGRRKGARGVKNLDPPSGDLAADWLKIFGDIDLPAEVQPSAPKRPSPATGAPQSLEAELEALDEHFKKFVDRDEPPKKRKNR